MKNIIKFLMITAIIILTAAPAFAGSGTIILDNSGGFFGIDSDAGVGMSEFAQLLEYDGYTVVETIQTNDDSSYIAESLLKKANILVLMNPTRSFGWEESKLIEEYVSNGGRLLLICDTPESAEYMNPLSGRFGVTYLPYYLGSVGVNSSFGEIRFVSAMPLVLDVEPDISIECNCSAGEWENRWNIPKRNFEDNFTLLAGIAHGDGFVVVLGDKDILLNENLEQNDDFVSFIFSWLSHEVVSNKLIYMPNKLEMLTTDGKIAVTFILIENHGDINQTMEFNVPQHLQNIVEFDPDNLTIMPDERAKVKVTANWNGNYSSISDILIVERMYGFVRTQDYINLIMEFQ